MLLDFCTRLPIFIVSTPRSGSNLFLEMVKQANYGYTTFNEPDILPSRMDDLKNAIDLGTRFITKIHIRHLIFNEAALPYENYVRDFLLSDKTYKVVIKRRDIISQIVSRYIAISRNVWHYNNLNVNSVFNDGDKISITLMKECVDCIKLQSHTLDETYVDNVFYYEDIIQTGFCRDNIKTPLPRNYAELIDIATSLFKSAT
jgi:hypothetical protein